MNSYIYPNFSGQNLEDLRYVVIFRHIMSGVIKQNLRFINRLRIRWGKKISGSHATIEAVAENSLIICMQAEIIVPHMAYVELTGNYL